jgi:UDP-GlcNAc:undecaprenyl-phosphate GlcNAc-1-phosphate transferase
MVYLIGGCVSFIVSVLLVPRVRQLAVYVGAVDKPDPRKIHRKLMPRIGGLAVFAGVVAGLGAAWLAVGQGWWEIPTDSFRQARVDQLPFLVLGSLIVLGVGIYDDIFGASPRTKILCQVIAAVLMFAGGIRFGQTVFGTGLHGIWIPQLLLTVGWLLGCSNAVNLIDGMDGLASGVSLIATATLFVLFGLGIEGVTNTYMATVMVCFCGALLGFLIFNFHPAVIFLGDTGSLFLGFAIGAFALQQRAKASTIVALAIPILVLGLPIADTILAILRRWGKRQSFSTPDKHHLHHRLLGLGFNQTQAVLILYAVCITCSSVAVIVISMDEHARVIVGVLAIAALGAVWTFGGGEFAATRRRIRESLLHGRRLLGRERAMKSAAMAMESADDVETLWEAIRHGLQRLSFNYVELQLDEAYDEVFAKRHFTWASAPNADHNQAWRGRYRLRTPDGRPLGNLTLARQGGVGSLLCGAADSLTLELEEMLNRLAGHVTPEEPADRVPPTLEVESEGEPVEVQ